MNSLLDKLDPMSHFAIMSFEEQAEANAYYDEQRYQQENTETDWTVRRDSPLSSREQSYLTAEEQELYNKWLAAPLAGHEKINFKALVKKLIDTKKWLAKMTFCERLHEEAKQSEAYKKQQTKSDILDKI